MMEQALASSQAVPAQAGGPPGYELIEPHAGTARRWLAPALSAAILLVAVIQLRHLDFVGLLRMTPRSPLFWAVFAVAYLFTPASEWVIFRRLWRLPARGILALLRKRLSNELLVGYSGEVYFYGWARRHATLVAAPFGAVKDVAILSAAVANVVTLLLVAVSWPLLRGLHIGLTGEALGLSAGIVALSSAAPLVFGGWLFSLPRRELRFITIVHAVRVAATLLLTGAMWMLVMPAAPLAWWLLLATLRMLVSRLPLLPNKDVVFAGLAAFMIGGTAAVTEAVSMIAALTLAAHLLLGVALAAAELSGVEARS